MGDTNGQLSIDAKVRQLVQQRITIDQPVAGEVQLRIEMEAGASNVQTNAPVLAGGYGDTLRVFLEPR